MKFEQNAGSPISQTLPAVCGFPSASRHTMSGLAQSPSTSQGAPHCACAVGSQVAPTSMSPPLVASGKQKKLKPAPEPNSGQFSPSAQSFCDSHGVPSTNKHTSTPLSGPTASNRHVPPAWPAIAQSASPVHDGKHTACVPSCKQRPAPPPVSLKSQSLSLLQLSVQNELNGLFGSAAGPES